MERERPPRSITGTSRGDILLASALVILAAAVAFAPCLGNGFTTWDDDVYVTANPLVRTPSWGRVPRAFTLFIQGNYQPLTLLAYAVQYRLFGPHPAPFHAVGLALHIANALLALLLFTMLGEGLWASAAAAALFAAAPARAESVAWIGDLKDLLAAFFFLLSLVFWLGRERGRRRTRYGLSLGAFLLALLSKGTAVTLPLILVFADRLKGRRDILAGLREKAPFFALSLVFGLVALPARASYQRVLQEWGEGPLYRALLGLHRLVFYHLPRQIAPLGQSLLNPFYDGKWDGLPPPSHQAAALLLLAAAAALLYLSARRSGKVAFGALFFLLAIAPSLTVVVVGQSADRFSYLPAVGLFYLAAAGIGRIARPPAPRAAVLSLAAAVVLALSFSAMASRRRCDVWRSSVTLWGDAVRLYPRVPSFRSNLGNALGAEGRLREAVAEYGRAIALDPCDAGVWSNRAAALLGLGEEARAEEDLERAISLDPGHVGALNNRGLLRARRGDRDAALSDFSRALETDPLSVDTLLNRCRTWALLGRGDLALADASRALDIDPGRADAWRDHAAVLAMTGDREGAAADLKRALALAPGNPETTLLLDSLRGRGRRLTRSPP